MLSKALGCSLKGETLSKVSHPEVPLNIASTQKQELIQESRVPQLIQTHQRPESHLTGAMAPALWQSRAGTGTPLVKCLPSVQKALGSVLTVLSRRLRVEAARYEVQKIVHDYVTLRPARSR